MPATPTVGTPRYLTLGVSEQRATLRIRLNRPQHHNSISDTMLAELHSALDVAEADHTCRLVVIEAEGDVFCNGMDLGEAAAQPGDRGAPSGSADSFFALLERLTTIRRVIVAKVEGRVSGGGVGLVAASDLVLASEAAQFSLPEALFGLLPCCVLPFLIRRVGFQPAYAMSLTTLPVDARTALGSHLVDEIATDPETVLRRWTVRISKFGDSAVGDLKQYMGRLHEITPETRTLAVSELDRLMGSPPVREAIMNFAGPASARSTR